MEQFVMPKKSGDLHKEVLKKKLCAFPGCKVEEKMTGRGKFCKEHRKKKYRKIIDADVIVSRKAEEDALNPNQTIVHKFTDPVKMVLTCDLGGCNEEFTITIQPKTSVYPKYCKEHRNPFKREMFLLQQK